jgi:hypothetical protein
MILFLITFLFVKGNGFLIEEYVLTMLQVITKCTKILTIEISRLCIHQSDRHFTYKFTIFLGFRVNFISRRTLTSLFITMLKE